MFSYDAEVRGVQMDAFVFAEPALDRRVFVRAIVVADVVDLLVDGLGLNDQLQELRSFQMAMLLLAQAIDCAGSGVERGKHRGGALRLQPCVMFYARPFFIASPG
jgi:hypothetical protein